MTDYSERWTVADEKGQGGQGKVYLAYEKSTQGPDEPPLYERVRKAVNTLGSSHYAETHEAAVESLKRDLAELLGPPSSTRGALKVLQNPSAAADPDNVVERLQREIAAMRNIKHPNLLRILDADSDGLWYVSEFHPGGTLEGAIGRFTGKCAEALRALRPLAEGVALLNEHGYVHRDIKPGNIFIGADDRLILGDFGLIFTDDDQTRLSDTWDNVGSRDWMPPWASTRRVEEVNASFDAFALGKVLWSMISDDPKLPFWYWDRPEYNLELKFADKPHLRLVNQILRTCVVENEEECLRDAGTFLGLIDSTLTRIDRGGQFLASAGGVDVVCRMCGVGVYQVGAEPKDPDNPDSKGAYGYLNSPDPLKIIECDYCGHVETFRWRNKETPRAWKEPTGPKR